MCPSSHFLFLFTGTRGQGAGNDCPRFVGTPRAKRTLGQNRGFKSYLHIAGATPGFVHGDFRAMSPHKKLWTGRFLKWFCSVFGTVLAQIPLRGALACNIVFRVQKTRILRSSHTYQVGSSTCLKRWVSGRVQNSGTFAMVHRCMLERYLPLLAREFCCHC